MKTAVNLRRLRRVWSWFTTALVAITGLLALILVGIRLVGITPYAVLSGSMEPALPVGALLFVQKTEFDQIQVGDIITFVQNAELEVATHRVVAVDSAARRLTTKGDANDTIDGSPVQEANLVGVVVFCIPKVGYFLNGITTVPGVYFAAAGVLVLLLGAFLPDLLGKSKKQEKAECKRHAKRG